MNMTRRDFCLAAAAAAATSALPGGGRGATALPGGKRRWFKGNLHCHTYYVLGGKGAMHPKVSMAWTQPYQRS